MFNQFIDKLKAIYLYAKVARIHALMMSILSITTVYCYCVFQYRIDGLVQHRSFLCVTLSILLFHLATNTISEYRDCQNGIDDIHSSETKYRLITGIVPEKHILYIGVVSFIMATVLGIISVIYGSVLLFIPGLIGAGISLFYSEWPLRLKYKPLGEICVFLTYGPLLFSACIISLINNLSLKDIVFSIPFGLITTTIVLANNIRDYKFDFHKSQTLATKFGLRFSYYLLFIIIHLAFIAVPIFIIYGIMPAASLMIFIAYPIVFNLTKKIINRSSVVNTLGFLYAVFFILTILSFLSDIYWNLCYNDMRYFL